MIMFRFAIILILLVMIDSAFAQKRVTGSLNQTVHAGRQVYDMINEGKVDGHTSAAHTFEIAEKLTDRIWLGVSFYHQSYFRDSKYQGSLRAPSYYVEYEFPITERFYFSANIGISWVEIDGSNSVYEERDLQPTLGGHTGINLFYLIPVSNRQLIIGFQGKSYLWGENHCSTVTGPTIGIQF